MLIDKGYYDYDFEKTSKKVHQEFNSVVMDEKQTRSLLAKFGIGGKHKKSLEELQEKSLEELQEIAMKQLEENV